MATTINAGRVRFVSRGTYNNSTQYYLFDLVDYNGSSYIAKENSLGNLPTNTQYWQLIAEKGNTGNTGQTGPVGATGNGISSITKTSTSGLVDTYTITYTNGNTTTFTITNGEDGEVTETELNVLRQKLENQQKVINQLPQVEGQGTEVTLENTIEAPFTKFGVEGNSTQDGEPRPDNEVPIYSAGDNVNLFDKDNEEQFLQNLTPDNSGLIVSAKTSTTSANYIRIIIIPCKSDANYVITRFLGGKTFFIYESDEYPTLNKQTTLLKRNNDAGKVSEIIKTSATAKYLLVKIYNTFASEYYSYDELISSIKIEKGNKATPYSPYGMGSINEKIQTSNLIDIIRTLGTPSNTGYDNTNKRTFDVTTLIKFLTANNYYNAGVQIDYSLIDNGIKITTKQAGYGIGFPVILSSAKTYTISANIDVIDNQMIRAIFYKEDGSYISNVTSSGTNKFLTFTTTDDTYFVVVMLTPKANVETTYSNIMLNEGNTALPYVEHKEQDYSIFVQQPMMDDDHFDRKNNKEVHTWIKYVLDGSNDENWSIRNNKFFINDNVNYNSWERVISPNGKSNIGVVSYSVLDNQTGFGLALAYGIRLNLENINAASGGTVEQLRTYLAEHPITIYVKLKEGAYEKLPCTAEQIQQLENLPSTYKDFTIIQSEDETTAYLEVAGIYDLNNLINN